MDGFCFTVLQGHPRLHGLAHCPPPWKHARVPTSLWIDTPTGDHPLAVRSSALRRLGDSNHSAFRPTADGTGALLIQHGSYRWAGRESQQYIEAGRVLLYRGVEQSRVFHRLCFGLESPFSSDLQVWRKYLTLQAEMLSESVLSFNTIHDRTKRFETGHLRDGTWLSADLAAQAGLDIPSPGFARKLWTATHQSYSLEQWVGKNKFGPHYVVFKTPLSNIRITTLFAGEARLVDPRLLDLVKAFGCHVESVIVST